MRNVAAMTSTPTGYRALLTDRRFTGVLATSVLARMPLGMIPLAILLFVRAGTGSFLDAGLTVAAYTLANAAAAPLQGALLDRMAHRPVLLIGALASYALLLVIVLAGHAGAPVAMLAAVAVAAGATLPPVAAGVRSLWPSVTPQGAALDTVYALDAASQEVIWTLGPVLVAAAVGLLSSAAAMLLCTGIGLVGTALFAGLPAVAEAGRSARREAVRVGALRSRGLRALLVSVTLVGVMIGAIEVGLPALAAHVGKPAAAGLLLALLSMGSMLGGVLHGLRSWSASTVGRHQALLVVEASVLAPLLLAGSLPSAIGLSLLAGIAIAPILACQYTLVGALSPEGAIAESFTWHNASLVAGIAAGTAIAGALTDRLGVRAPLLLACLAMLTSGLIATLWRSRIAQG